ncbi:MAG: SRPBCC family protein [Dehalococcoidia bacterium]
MISIEQSVVINRPIEEVYAYVVDVENCPQWRSSCLEAKRFTEGPIRAGTTERYTMRVFGRRQETTMEVTEYEPHRKYAWRATSGGLFPLRGWFTFQTVDGGTKVTETIEAEPSGFLKLAKPFIVRMFRREGESDFSNLKEILEAQAEASA